MNYHECVFEGKLPSAEALIEARRMLADWHSDTKLLRHRRNAARQIEAMSGEPESAAQITLLKSMLLTTSSEELRKQAAKIDTEAAELRAHLHTGRQDRELAQQEDHCAALASTAGHMLPREKYARALDRLATLREREALRNDSAEAKARARLADLGQALQQVHAQMLVPENFRWSAEAKSNTVT